MTVDVTAQYRPADGRVRGIERAGRNAARRGLWGLVELRANELWALRDDGALSLRDRGLCGHAATDLYRMARVGRARDACVTVAGRCVAVEWGLVSHECE